MNQKSSNRAFLLRLPVSMKEQAVELAKEDGTSLNHFISLAVAEKIARLERGLSTLREQAGTTSRQPFQVRSPIRKIS